MCYMSMIYKTCTRLLPYLLTDCCSQTMCSQYQEPLDLAPQYGYPYNQDPHLYRPESVCSRPFIGAQHLDFRHSSTFGNEGQHYVLQTSAELGHHEICTPESINTFNDTQHIDAFHSLTSANEDQHYMRQLPADLEDKKIYGAPRMRALLVRLRLVKFLSPLTFWSSRLVSDVGRAR